MTSTSNSDDPLATYNELLLSGVTPNLDEFCARYPEHPSLRERIHLLSRLQQDLRRLVSPEEAPVLPETPVFAPAGFQILGRLGAGGMGTVYLAEQEHPRRLCALKVMRQPTPAARKRFRREADLAARLTHPNVAAVYVFGVEEDVAYLATEYVHGFSLRALLQVADVVEPSGGMDWIVEALRHLSEGVRAQTRASMPGPVKAMLEMATAVAEALGAAHERGVVHRDIKPSNIMVTFDGTPKLIDFGIAVADDAPDARFTQAGAFVGSWDYAAPEQLRGEVDLIGPWSDTYALGATLFEMLTLRTPFECASFADRAAMASAPLPHGPRFYNPAVPPAVDALVRRAMDPDTARRFQDGREMAEALAHSATLPRILPRLPGPLAPLASLSRSHVALGVSLVVATLFACLWASERAAHTDLTAAVQVAERRSAQEVLSWQLEHARGALQKCLAAEHKPPAADVARRVPPLPTRFRAHILVSRGSVTLVTTPESFGLTSRAVRCFVETLDSLELPGVGMSEPLPLSVELRLVGEAPLEHVP